MAKQLIINAIEPREIRAAIVEDGEPINFFVERSTRKFQKGNIYRARVTSIEPHLQAAFVELEKGQHGFLSLSDVIFPDGGISLINGLAAPALPEPEKKNPPKDELRRHEEKPKPKLEQVVQKQAQEKPMAVEASVAPSGIEPDVTVESFFDDSPEKPVVLGPKPPRTSLSPEAGNWILGFADQSEPAPLIEEIVAEVVETEAPVLSEPAVLEMVEPAVIEMVEPEVSVFSEPAVSEMVEPAIPELSEPEIPVFSEPEFLASLRQSDRPFVLEEDSLEDLQGETNHQFSVSPEADEISADNSVDTAIFELDAEESAPSTPEQGNLDEGIDEDDLDEEPENDKSEDGESRTSGGDPKPKRHGKSQRGGFVHKRRPFMRIENVLEVGQYISVQIIKEGIGNKAPMVTTFISLAGHYMVLTPGGDRSGVSKQVQSQAERSRLRNFIEKSEIPDRCGLIVRTAAEGVDLKDLDQDIQHLCISWKEIQEQFKRTPRSGIIRKEENLTTRLVRDYYNQDIDEVWIDDRDTYEEIRQFFERGMSDQAQRVKLYTGERPIFYNYNLDKPLQGLFQRRVNLPGGGSLIFDQGEAMLVIDVNSGTFREGEDDEDTAFRLNLLACKEVARQVQMRDVGGIIMIDFVDMRRISNRSKVEKELEKAFKGDKARLNVMSIGALGVLQMSRQRTKDSLRGSLYSPCEVCEGTGLVPSKIHSAMGILREIRGNLRRFNGAQLKVATTAEMATEMFNLYKGELVKMEEEENCQIAIEIDGSLGHGEFKLISKGGSPQRSIPSGQHSQQHHAPSNNAQQHNTHFGHGGNSRNIKDTPALPKVDGAVETNEGERRSKKKRKRNKQRDDAGHVGDADHAQNRPPRHDMEQAGPPLGIIKAKPADEVSHKKEFEAAHPENQSQVSRHDSASTRQNTELESAGIDAQKSVEKKSEPEAQKQARQTEGVVKPESLVSKSERPDKKISSAQRRSQRNSPGKSKEKNKAHKTVNKDLNKAESTHSSPPASEKE